MMDRPAADVTAGVLAGGRGTRMGGCDKGLTRLAGRPLVEHVLAAVRPQVGATLISANRNRSRYAAYGHGVVGDEHPGFSGPLAGIAGVMAAAQTPRLVIVPCDGPRLPGNLVARLYAGLSGADIAAVHDGARLQPLFALLGVYLLADLRAYLDAGGQSVQRWYARHRLVQVDFSDVPTAFANVNRPAQLEAMAQRAGV